VSNLKKIRIIRASAYLWGLFCFFLLLKPNLKSTIDLPQWLIILPIDKIVHFALWFIWISLYELSKPSVFIKPLYFYFWIVLSIPFSEWLQYYLNWGRTADFYDILADLIGLTTGFIVSRHFRKYLKK